MDVNRVESIKNKMILCFKYLYLFEGIKMKEIKGYLNLLYKNYKPENIIFSGLNTVIIIYV